MVIKKSKKFKGKKEYAQNEENDDKKTRGVNEIEMHKGMNYEKSSLVDL
jgi:hypothetical protein